MKKRIALLLCVAMLIGIFAGCDVDLSSIFPSTSETEPTEGPTEKPTEESTEKLYSTH